MPKSQATEERLRLCCAELERRVRKGELSRAEDFFSAYPDLAATPEIALDLIYAEYLVRCELGGSPSPDEYYGRFPQWREALFHQFEIHVLLNGPPDGAEVAPWPLSANTPQPWKTSPDNFEIFEEIARGSMGVVYKAWQKDVNRVVALKVILARALSTPDQLARFRVEATAIGRLFHPNIVQIFKTQEWEGCPFLVLEHVDGETLAKHWQGKAQPPRAVATLTATLAAAMQYAHERAVVHRDLRPGNILINRQGVPKIIDFGLAKLDLLADDDLTMTGQILGTPSYMSPEQAEGLSRDHGPHVDVYALGAVIYEGLTGRPPFRGQTILETLYDVNTKEPVPPRRIQPGVPRDLETICLKCLQKEPHQRYASAKELADDIHRFLNHEPIWARPVTALERASRWCRRNALVASLMGALTLCFMLGLGLVTWKWLQEVHARAAADAAREIAQEQIAKSERMAAGIVLDRGVNLGEHGHVDHALLLFAKSLEQAVRVDDRALERAARVNLAAFRQQLLRRRTTLAHANWVWQIAFSRDGKFFVTACRDKVARVWETATGKLLGKPMHHDAPVWAVAVSPDDRSILTGCGDPNGGGGARLWDAATGQPLGAPFAEGRPVGTVGFSADGKTLLTLDAAGEVRLWDANSREPAGEPVAHPGTVRTAMFSPDGKLLATAGADVRLWHVPKGTPAGPVLRHPGDPERLPKQRTLVVATAFSSDGTMLATGAQITDADTKRWLAGEVCLWNVSTGELAVPPMQLPGPVKTVVFSPDDTRLLTGGFKFDARKKDHLRGEARLWDVASGRQIGPTLDDTGPIWAAGFGGDGEILVTGGETGHARFWLAATGEPIGMSSGPGNARCIGIAPDRRTVVIGHTYEPAVAEVWELPAGGGAVLPPLHDQSIRALLFSRNGKLVATASEDRTARLWDVAAAQPMGRPFPHHGAASALVFSPDSKCLLTVNDELAPQLWCIDTGEPHSPPGPRRTEIITAACTFGSQRLLLRDRNNRAFWWESSNGKTEDWPFAIDASRVIVCDAGKWLATAQAAQVQLRDMDSAKPIGQPLRHRANVTAFAFCPDGKLLATGSEDGNAYLWKCAGATRLGSTLLHPGPLRGMVFSGDGRALLAWSGSNHVRLWNTSTGAPLVPPLLHPAEIAAVQFTPDGRTMAVASGAAVYCWDVATGRRLGPPLRHPDAVTHLAISPDGRRLATACADRSVRFWDVLQPAVGNVADIKAWVEALTGRQLDDDGAIHEIDATALRDRRRGLEASAEPFPRPALHASPPR
ncbi:MAG: serine/threonine protein kinase [Gemmataceae bacterium]|nr:serine/threonine protein kinase [Gemmataceae bacterium]